MTDASTPLATKDIDVLTICQLLRPAEERWIASRYRLTRADKAAVPDEIASKARALITSGLDGAPAELINRMPMLEIITVNSVGYDLVDMKTALSRHIPVTHTPDVLTDDVADLAIGLMIMTSRRLAQADRFVRAGRWRQEKFPVAGKVTGKKLGILGLGRIGRAIAQRAEGFGMEILYTDRARLNTNYRFLPDLISLAKESDFLMVATSAGPDARHMVNGPVLEALGSDGILINIARGSVVDEKALVAALEGGKLGGAGLDVFENEPSVPEVLFGRDDVVLLPHIASSTRETRGEMGRLVIRNLEAWFTARPLVTPTPETLAMLANR
jgi:lactate dehydrogenase-like 2-hydroxyacid dehydrogenase